VLKKNSGFTLIELMIVVVIIGILAAIAVPNFIAMQDRAKEASVKSNCHTVQLAAEDVSVQADGVYGDRAAVVLALPGGNALTNPFSKVVGQPIAGAAAADGDTGYVPFAAGGVNVGYTIDGMGKGANVVLTLTSGQ